MNTFELYKFVSKKLEAHYCERKARAMVNQYDDASMSELKGIMDCRDIVLKAFDELSKEERI